MGWMPRRLMLLLAGSALLLAPLLTAGTGRAHACSCVWWPTPPPLEAFNEASAVFSGTVVSVRRSSSGVELGDGGGPPYWPVEIEVDVVWKGPIAATTFVYVTHSTACGYPAFEVGEDFLVYARAWHEAMIVGMCSRTRPIGSAFEDLFALGDGATPAPGVTGALHPSGDEGHTPDSATAVTAATSGDVAGQTPTPGETADAQAGSTEPLRSLAWWTPLLAGIAAAALIIRRWARRRELE